MKKSIGDNMSPKGWSFERGVELIKKAGFDGVDLRSALRLLRIEMSPATGRG